MNLKRLATLVFLPWLAGGAMAANILFVSDCQTDAINIPTILRGEGYTVTVVINDFAPAGPTPEDGGDNPTLRGNLSAYQAVYWSATGLGSGTVHNKTAVFANLTEFVYGGGRVFVTGYDSIVSPDDPNLQAFIGATAAADGGVPNGPCIDVANVLTTGQVDIRNLQPTGGHETDLDSVTGLTADTVGVCPSNSPGWSWTLRTVGKGYIAYVSNGIYANEHASWLVDTLPITGANCYNAALRNFASFFLDLTIVPGLMFTAHASEVLDLPTPGRFFAKPKVYGTFVTDNGKSGKGMAKALTPINQEVGNGIVDYEWTKKIKLYDPKAFKAAQATGTTTASEWLAQHPQGLILFLRLTSKETVDQSLYCGILRTPIITSAIMDNQAGGVSLITLEGIWFGTKKPKVWREYRDGVAIKRQKFKVLTPLDLNFLDSQGKPACMDYRLGTSKVVVEVPDSFPDVPTGWLVIDNGVGLATVSDPSGP